MQAYPDVALERHCKLLEQAYGERISPRTMSRAISRIGWTRKKSLGGTERREEERAKWREQMRRLDANRLVFLGEYGSNIALTPLYAPAP